MSRSTRLEREYRKLLEDHGLTVPGELEPSPFMKEMLKLEMIMTAFAEGTDFVHSEAFREQMEWINDRSNVTYNDALGMLSDLVEKGIAAAGLSLDHEVFTGLFPTGSFNAQAVPFSDGTLILLNRGLLSFLRIMMKLFAFSVVFSDLDKCGKPTRDTDKAPPLMDYQERVEAFAELLLAYVVFEEPYRSTPYMIEGGLRGELARLIQLNVTEYVIAHEYGHAVAGHLTAPRQVVASTVVGDITLVEKDWHQELEADINAMRIMLASSDRVVDSNSKAFRMEVRLAAPLIFLALDELISRTALLLNGINQDLFIITDHPPSSLRSVMIRRFYREHGAGQLLDFADLWLNWLADMEEGVLDLLNNRESVEGILMRLRSGEPSVGTERETVGSPRAGGIANQYRKRNLTPRDAGSTQCTTLQAKFRLVLAAWASRLDSLLQPHKTQFTTVNRYLEKSADALYADLGCQFGVRRYERDSYIFPTLRINTSERPNAYYTGSLWLKAHRKALQDFLCNQWNYKTRRGAYPSRQHLRLIVDLATALKATLSPGIDPILVAAILYKEGLDRFCHLCENADEYVRLALSIYSAWEPSDEAESILRKALEIEPDHADANYYLGNFASVAGNWELAVTYLERAVANNPAEFKALNDLGWLLIEYQIDPNRGLSLAKQALSMIPEGQEGLAHVLDTVGWATYQVERNLAQAEEYLRMSLEISTVDEPFFVLCVYHLVVVLVEAGRAEEAAQYCKAVLELDPYHPSDCEAKNKMMELCKVY